MSFLRMRVFFAHIFCLLWCGTCWSGPTLFWSKACQTKVCNACRTTNSALPIAHYVQPSQNARQERRKEAKPERKSPETAQFPSSASISIPKLKTIENLNYFCLFFSHFHFVWAFFRIFTTNIHCLNHGLWVVL